MSTAEIQSKIDNLKSKLSGDMMKDMEIRDQIHNLEMTMRHRVKFCNLLQAMFSSGAY